MFPVTKFLTIATASYAGASSQLEFLERPTVTEATPKPLQKYELGQVPNMGS